MARNGSGDRLPTVYAYQDAGILVAGTRWEPRRVFCTRTANHRDAPGPLHVVKFRRTGDPVSTAASISEIVCHILLKALGIPTFTPALVRVSASLARQYARHPDIGYSIPAGLHFGTVYRPDVIFVDPVPAPLLFWERLAAPEELIAIWAADSWFMNLDRAVYGNMVLAPAAGDRWHLLAADQSDCFLGASALADGSCFERSGGHGAAGYLPLLERAILERGVEPLRRIAQRIEGAAGRLPAAVAAVPAAWWPEAHASPAAIVTCLTERARRIGAILQLERWEGLANATRGGFPLGG